MGLIARDDETQGVMGYCFATLEMTRYAIVRFGVDLEFRRCGVGTSLVTRLTSKLCHKQRRHVSLDVPDDLLGTHLFLKALGFTAKGIEYCSGGRDLYRFQYSLRNPSTATEAEDAVGQ